jgi:hypothetical protein
LVGGLGLEPRGVLCSFLLSSLVYSILLPAGLKIFVWRAFGQLAPRFATLASDAVG